MTDPKSLVDQIRRGQYTGTAFIDEEPLEALERVIHGPIRDRDDLLHAEVALRALLLHDITYAIWWPFRPSGVAEIFESLAQEPPRPALVFNTGDPAIPDTIRAQLSEAIGLTSIYMRRTVAAAGGAGFAMAAGSFGSSSTIATFTPDGHPLAIAAPAFMDVFNGAMQIHDAAVRQLIGYFGGASMSVTAIGRNPCREMLAELDKHYDTSGASGFYDTVDVQLPVFLKVLLHRAASREEMPRVLRELKKEMEVPSRAIFRSMMDYDGASSDVDRLDARRRIGEQTARLSSLLRIDTSLSGRLRGMGHVAEAVMRLFAGQVGGAILKVADAASNTRTLNRALTPSLADNLSRMAWSVEQVASEDLITRHFADAELRALRASFA